MKKLLIVVSIFFSLIVFPVSTFCLDTTTITEEETPTAAKKDTNNNSLIYSVSLTAVVVLAYVYYSYKKDDKLSLQVNEVNENDDGTLTINLGYDNKTNKLIDVDYNNLSVKKGMAIILKSDDSKKMMPGKHESVLTAVIEPNTSLNWSVNDLSISVEGKKVKRY